MLALPLYAPQGKALQTLSLLALQNYYFCSSTNTLYFRACTLYNIAVQQPYSPGFHTGFFWKGETFFGTAKVT